MPHSSYSSRSSSAGSYSSHSSSSSLLSSSTEVHSQKVRIPRHSAAMDFIVWAAGGRPSKVGHIRRDDVTTVVESSSGLRGGGRGRAHRECTDTNMYFVAKRGGDRYYDDLSDVRFSPGGRLPQPYAYDSENYNRHIQTGPEPGVRHPQPYAYAVPAGMRSSTSSAMPGPVPSPVPGPVPGPMPSAMPSAMPGTVPGPMPGSVPPWRPDQGPGGAGSRRAF